MTEKAVVVVGLARKYCKFNNGSSVLVPSEQPPNGSPFSLSPPIYWRVSPEVPGSHDVSVRLACLATRPELPVARAIGN